MLSPSPEDSFAPARIMLATDFSDTAMIAAGYAAGFAKRFMSHLEILTAIDLSSVCPGLEGLSQPALLALMRSSEEALDRLQTKLEPLKTQRKVMHTFLASAAILDEAVDSRADMVVMGTTSKHGLKKFILGSTAENVIRTLSCPTLTVGPLVAQRGGAPLRFDRIVYGADFSENGLRAAKYACDLAFEFGSQLHLCHVLKTDKAEPCSLAGELTGSAQEEIIHHYEAKAGRVVSHVQQGRADEEILRISRLVQADLIVLGTRHASAWQICVSDGVVPSVLANAECPVMTVCNMATGAKSRTLSEATGEREWLLR